MRPVVVLGVILHRKDDVPLRRIVQKCSNALDNPSHALLAGDFGASLAGQDATEATAETRGDIDHSFLVLDLPAALTGVSLREIGRATQHGHFEVAPSKSRPHVAEVRLIKALEETTVHFQPIDRQISGHLDPLENGHGAVDYELVHETLGKCRKLHECEF